MFYIENFMQGPRLVKKKYYYHTASYRACPDLVQDFRYPTHGIKVFEEYLAVAFCTDALEI